MRKKALSMLEIKEVTNKKDLKQFVNLPYELYKGNKYWVPPIKKDELKQWDAKTNPAYEFCDVKLWIVTENGKVKGRIAAIINHLYNEKVKEKYGRFSRIEFVDDERVSSLLLQTAESWLKEQGMTKVHGPLGFTNLDTQGLLIEGFEELQSIASVYHLPYYKEHIEKQGYTKEVDWVEYHLRFNEKVLERGKRGAALLKRRFGLEVKSFSEKKELEKYAGKIFEILNPAFESLHYVVPLNKKMQEMYKNKYLPLLDPRFVFMVKDKEKIVGFVIGLPSLSKALQKAKGSLYPFGILHIMNAYKHIEVLDLTLVGVLPEYHTKGVAVLLFDQIHQALAKINVWDMETTGVLEDNDNVLNNWKNYENRLHKRRRCFVKTL